MNRLTSAQISLLNDVTQSGRISWYSNEKPLRSLTENGYIERTGDDHDNRSYKPTDKGKAYIARLRAALEEGRLVDMNAGEKRIILSDEMFEEKDRHRLLFDKTASVRLLALRVLTPTADDYERLAGCGDPDIRAKALGRIAHADPLPEGLDEIFRKFMGYDDRTTIAALLPALKNAKRTELVTESDVTRWLNAMDRPVVIISSLREAGISLTDEQIAMLCGRDDEAVMWTLTEEGLVERLTSAQIGHIIDVGDTMARNNVAQYAEGLSIEQIERLEHDPDGVVAARMRRRLAACARAIRLFRPSEPEERRRAVLAPYDGEMDDDLL